MNKEHTSPAPEHAESVFFGADLEMTDQEIFELVEERRHEWRLAWYEYICDFE